MKPSRGSEEDRLDALLRAYAALPVPEPSANFMPGVWKRIESRQTVLFSFRRMSQALVTAALALSVALGVYTAVPHSQPSEYLPQSYLEALAQANEVYAADSTGPVTLDLSDSGR
jgi:hypothetical protein